MIRPATLRLAAAPLAARASVARRAPIHVRANLRPVSSAVRTQTARTYATAAGAPPPPAASSSGGGGGGNNGMYIVLAALLAIAGGGYFYLKPVRDVAAKVNSGLDTVKDKAGNVGEYSGHLGAVAQAFLPPGAFALYSALANQPGGLNGFLSNLKDKDLQGVIDEVKKAGGEDVKRVMEKVEKRVKDAKGKAQDVDWKALAEDLKKELPESAQGTIEMLIGKIPDKGDVDAMFNKLKDVGEQSKKEIEASAKKILDQVKKAQKDGKNKGDALLKGLKEATPGDVDTLIKQLKDTAKQAGLPADTIESWLKSKAEDGKISAEQAASQVKDKLKTGAKYIPGEPKDLIDQVKQFSPSIAELLAEAMKEAGVVDDKLNRKV